MFERIFNKLIDTIKFTHVKTLVYSYFYYKLALVIWSFGVNWIADHKSIINTTKNVEITVENPNSFIYKRLTVSTDPPQPMSDYEFNPKDPDEWYKGYVTKFFTSNGENYFVWTRNKPDLKITSEINGFFVAPNVGKMQNGHKNEYLTVLIPILKHDQIDNQ